MSNSMEAKIDKGVTGGRVKNAETFCEDVHKVLGDHHSVDALLAHELNQMSVSERDIINEEIHGVRLSCPNETPQLLEDSLEQFAVELAALPADSLKEAYDASLAFPESYVHTADFRLIFLRCEFFDSRKAALRMTKYLYVINWAFGEKILQRDICEDDFDEASTEFLRSGYHQLLPGMDRSGRRVFGNFGFPHKPNIKHRIQSCLFVLLQAAKGNISVQRRGVINVSWMFDISISYLNEGSTVYSQISDFFPVRYAAIHACFPLTNSVTHKMARTMLLMCMGPDLRKRVRLHFGSHMECLYKLQTFGIQSLQMPINTNTGKIKAVNHHKWLTLHQNPEAKLNKKNVNGIECPERQDVLFGRGWPKMGHPGNAIFRNTIEARLDKYNAAESKRDKTMIAWNVVCELREFGARFLKEDKSGWWVEVSNEIARQKVSIGFRDIRKARHKLSSKLLNGEDNTAVAPIAIQAATSSKRKIPSPSSGDSENSISRNFYFIDGGKRNRPTCVGNGECF